MSRAKFMEGRPGGISDGLYGATKRAHMAQNWQINRTFEGVSPHPNGVGGGDNQSYRLMPGRKHGMYSG